jgi:hypothetical protein
LFEGILLNSVKDLKLSSFTEHVETRGSHVCPARLDRHIADGTDVLIGFEK